VPAWYGGCPNTSAFQWIYNTPPGATTQNLCNCFPPNVYSPSLGANGGGTNYLQVSGVVSFIEGATTGSGTGSFYMENSCDPNHSLYIYQDASAGKTVTVGNFVTINAIAYSYYGLVEMQNTLSVAVVNRTNAVCSPIVLPNLQALDVNLNGHCSATTMLYRANRITINYVTVTKVFMYEPFPPNLNYWYNNTFLGPAYSAAWNASAAFSGYFGGSGAANWYNMNNCRDAFGVTAIHPITKKPFICGFEITDQSGFKAVVDQCPYSSNGGLLPLFLGTDYAGAKPLAVGDTLLSVTGVLKMSRGSYGSDGQGGYLAICAMMDPTLMAGRNQPFPSSTPSVTTPKVPSLGSACAAQPAGYGPGSKAINVSLSVRVCPAAG